MAISNSTAPTVEGFTADPYTSWTLPAEWYYEPDFYDAEREDIFHRTWRIVGHKSEMANPGDYLTVDVAGQSVFVVRDRKGTPNAFYNVCKHRAHELVSGRRGNVKAVITCPYHAWAYGLDGALRNARNCENVKGFDKADFGLSRVRVEEFCGFVFVNLDPEARPMREFAPGYAEEMGRCFPDLEQMAYGDQKDFDIAANWKVVVENAIEGYHFPNSGSCHKELCDLVDMDSARITTDPNWIGLYAGPGDPSKAPYPFPEDGRGGQTDHFVTLYLWPDTLIYSWPYADMVSTFVIVPTGPQTTRLENAYYHVPGRGDDTTTKASEHWFNEGLGLEDAALNVGVQKGIVSKGYSQGRFIMDPENSGVSEHGVHHFQSMVRNALSG